MWAIILLILVTLPWVVLIGLCVAPLPKQFRVVPVSVGVLLIVPYVIAATFYLPLAGMPLSPPTVFMLLLASLVCYFVVKAAAFLGLDMSFRLFGRDKSVRFPIAGTVLAIAASALDAVLTATVFILAYTIDYPGKLDAKGTVEVFLVVQSILLGGVCLGYVFIVVMYGNRKLIARSSKSAKQETKTIEKRPQAPFKGPAKGPPPSGKATIKGPESKPPWKPPSGKK